MKPEQATVKLGFWKSLALRREAKNYAKQVVGTFKDWSPSGISVIADLNYFVRHSTREMKKDWRYDFREAEKEEYERLRKELTAFRSTHRKV